ncbi:FKBP-type peptidyl-prolyl cis-trans isomerase [Caulobacter sp. SSI4214]|uniref:FKBP-type peptidyl-prolyl cis-trans isomerase n=1 Tax=Caulobacter sp. SSI4214 TaxID=2575739 RepID=UPI00143AB9DA|nr:FKBP-type peptidyl-prolyl cis-trans isomerase [Caulobacter sp. SSI4214]
MHRRALFLTLAAIGLTLAACGPGKKAQENQAAADAFMAKNAKEPGVVTLPQGLQYKVVREGPPGGQHPTPADEVKVHYEGKLLDGTVFDSSYERGVPAVFPLDGLVPAWVIALQRMKAGDEWILYVPPALGYGAEDKGPIPANSVMIFKIELLGVNRIGPGKAKE